LTAVLAFKDYTAIGAETKYTQEIAINLLNKYIFPSTAYEGEINNVQNPSRVVQDASRISQIKSVKRGLISWVFSHEDDAEQYIPNFNEQEFDNINRDAFNSILDMSIQDFLRGVEGTTVEALTQSIDNLDVAAAGPDKFTAIAEAVKDGKFFNTNITLRDIKNKTGESEQFYKLTPTTVDDPLFQQYLQMTEDVQYATASSAREGTKKDYLDINKMLEVAKRWAHVISPREFTKILNGVESNTTDEELEEYRRQGVDIKWEGLNSPEDVIELMKGKDKNAPWYTILANFLARSIVDKSTPDHISYNYELFYPLSVFDEFSKMDELLDKIKSESLDKLEKFMDKNTYDFSFDVKEFKEDLTFNNNFSDGDDLNKFLDVCYVIELVNEHDNKKLKGLDAVNKLASEIADEVLEQLSGGKIILTESTTKQVDVELDGKNLPLRILEGTNPISINDMEDLLGEAEYTKDTINMLDGQQDDESIIETFKKITGTKKSERQSRAVVYTSTPDKDTVELSLDINLDLSKKSPIPDAAKSMTKTRKPNIQKFNQELNLQKYATENTDDAEPVELSADEKLLNIAERALDTLQDFSKTHRMLSIIKGNNVQKILRQTQITSIISILNAVISSASNEVKEQYSERLSNITNVIEEDDLQYDKLMTVIEPLYTLISDITQQLGPSDDELMPETSDMSDEEYEEWAKRKEKDLQELEDEESDEEEGIVQDDTLSPEMFLELEREIKNPDDIGTIAHIRKITESDNVDDAYREKLDFLNEFGRSEENTNAINSLKDEKEKLKGLEGNENKKQLLNVNAEYDTRTLLQQLMQVNEEASVSFINSLITQVKKSISRFKQSKNITDDGIDSRFKLLKGYNIKQMVIDILTRSAGFNTVDIADLSGTIKLTFIFNKSYGGQKRFGNKLKSFAKLQYSQKKRVESTSGNVDFTVVPLHGRNYTMRSVLTQQETARISDGDKRKGEIYDFFKVRIYNELYSNINELDRILKRVEAE